MAQKNQTITRHGETVDKRVVDRFLRISGQVDAAPSLLRNGAVGLYDAENRKEVEAKLGDCGSTCSSCSTCNCGDCGNSNSASSSLHTRNR